MLKTCNLFLHSFILEFMSNKAFLLLPLLLFTSQCRNIDHTSNIELSKKQIRDTEKEFEALVEKKGIAEAFYYYAATEATMK